MSRWTIKELNEADDLTFAMCILSERRERLNQEAPLAKKLKKAFHTLEELRDICRENEHHRAGIISAKEAIFRAVERENNIADIKTHLGLGEYDDENVECKTNLYGMEPKQVIADHEVMERILYRFDNGGVGEDYWYSMEAAIEQGIEDVLEARKGANE